MSKKLEYKTGINFNGDKGVLKKLTDENGGGAYRLLLHMLDNTKRKTGKDFLNKNPEMESIYEGQTPDELKKEFEKIQDKLPKGGKGAKPFRFFAFTLNVEPTKENEKIIMEGKDKIEKLFIKHFGKDSIKSIALHLNESRPGIHICMGNYSKQKNKGKGGVGKNGKKVPMSGDGGAKILAKVGEEGGEVVKELAEKYGLEYKQEATTNLNKTIQQTRKTEIVEVENEGIKRIQKEIFNPIQSEVMTIDTKTGPHKICCMYDPKTGNMKLWQRVYNQDLRQYGNGQDLDGNGGRSEEYRTKIRAMRDNFKSRIEEQILNIQPESKELKGIKERIRGI